MTQSTNKFEQLLELLINEENDKAQALFHEIVVEKSRDIYEGLVDSETAVEEAKEASVIVKAVVVPCKLVIGFGILVTPYVYKIS